MTHAVFLDTNILIYATLQNDPRADVARAIVGQGGIISVQVLNEFTNVAHRKLRQPWVNIMASLQVWRTIFPVISPIDLATHDIALQIAANDHVSFYDALIVAAALEANCTTLMTEDMQDGRVFRDRLTLRNPFRANVA